MKIKNLSVLFIALTLVVFTASGCVRAYHVQIDSISDRTVQLNKIYQIVPGNKDTNVNDLQFKEFAGLLVNAMSLQGYKLANDSQAAEIEVYLSYGVGEPETHTYSYTTPVWGQTGVNTYTQSSVLRSPDHTGSTQYTTTYEQPQYGVTGFTNQTAEYTAYKKFIILDAFDIKNGRQGANLNEIWKTSITGTGKSKDLRKVFPAFLAAASTYIGVNTGSEITVNIEADSVLIKQIAGN